MLISQFPSDIVDVNQMGIGNQTKEEYRAAMDLSTKTKDLYFLKISREFQSRIHAIDAAARTHFRDQDFGDESGEAYESSDEDGSSDDGDVAVRVDNTSFAKLTHNQMDSIVTYITAIDVFNGNTRMTNAYAQYKFNEMQSSVFFEMLNIHLRNLGDDGLTHVGNGEKFDTLRRNLTTISTKNWTLAELKNSKDWFVGVMNDYNKLVDSVETLDDESMTVEEESEVTEEEGEVTEEEGEVIEEEGEVTEEEGEVTEEEGEVTEEEGEDAVSEEDEVDADNNNNKVLKDFSFETALNTIELNDLLLQLPTNTAGEESTRVENARAAIIALMTYSSGSTDENALFDKIESGYKVKDKYQSTTNFGKNTPKGIYNNRVKDLKALMKLSPFVGTNVAVMINKLNQINKI